MKIPNGQSESQYRRRTEKARAKRKRIKRQRSTKHTHKTKDRVTRTPLTQGMNSGFPEGLAAHSQKWGAISLFAYLRWRRRNIWDDIWFIYIYKISFLFSCMSLSELDYDKLSQSELNGGQIMKAIKYSRFLDIMKIWGDESLSGLNSLWKHSEIHETGGVWQWKTFGGILFLK